MAQGFYQRINTPDGPVLVHVNRRGCKGKWTAADDEALKALVIAAVKHVAAGKPTPRLPAGDDAGAPSTSD